MSGAAISWIFLAAGGSSGAADADVSANIAAILQSRFPHVKIEQVSPVPRLAGIYEVVTQSEIVYTDASANLLIAGKILDTRTQANITEERWSELHTIDFNALPLALAIKTVRGDGSRRLAVFEDPDCPYCQELERAMQGLTDVTIYTFLYPLESVHPDARQKAVNIWCAKERATAWSEWMLKRVAPPNDSCKDEPVARILELGATLKVNSTPTLFFADGRRNDGALNRQQLEQKLADARPRK
jgi:thiol:disulfide interchange protein DsbC